eukprot:9483778-Pyramimonas_sp.AAC.2
MVAFDISSCPQCSAPAPLVDVRGCRPPRGDWDKVQAVKEEYEEKRVEKRKHGEWQSGAIKSCSFEGGQGEGRNGRTERKRKDKGGAGWSSTLRAVAKQQKTLGGDAQCYPNRSNHLLVAYYAELPDSIGILVSLGWRPEIAETEFGQMPHAQTCGLTLLREVVKSICSNSQSHILGVS